MKRSNKTGLVFILLLVLSVGVVLLPVGFALQSPEDLLGKVYDADFIGEVEPVNVVEDTDDTSDYYAFYFYKSEADLNEDISRVGYWNSNDILNNDRYDSDKNGYHMICSNGVYNSYTGYSNFYNTCKNNEINVLSGISKYWKVIKYIGQDHYYKYNYALVPYEYKEPTYELSCNPEKISKGGYSDCSLKATYYSKLRNIDFNLKINDYEISDIKAGDDFENLKVEDNNYSLTGKKNMEESDEGKETTIITFRITSQTNKEVNINDNIKIENINYTDQVEEGTKDVVTATVKQEKKLENNNLSNPLTSNNIIYILISLAILITVISFNTKIKR